MTAAAGGRGAFWRGRWGRGAKAPMRPEHEASAAARPALAAAWLPRLLALVLLAGLALGFTLLAIALAERELRWSLYPLAGLVVGSVALLADPRRAFLACFVLAVSVNLNLWITEPRRLLYVGNSSPTALFVPLVVLAGLTLLAHQRVVTGRPLRWGWPITGPALGYMLVTGVSALVSDYRFFGICALFELLNLYLVFLVMLNVVRTREDAELVMTLLLATMAAQCGVFFLQKVIGFSFTPTGRMHAAYGAGPGLVRASGTVGTTPSGFATFMEPLVLMTLTVFRASPSHRQRLVMGVVTLVGMLAILLTLNRSSWVGLPLGVVAVELLCRRRGLAPRGAGGGLVRVAVLLGLASLVALPVAAERFRDTDTGVDFETRTRLMSIAANMIADHPVLGVGPGGYGFKLPEYAGGEGWNYVVHNEYLLIGADRGVLGFAAWLLLMGAGVRQAARGSRLLCPPFRPVAVGLQAALVVYAWELFWNSYQPFCSQAIIWLYFGFVAALLELPANAEPVPAAEPTLTAHRLSRAPT